MSYKTKGFCYEIGIKSINILQYMEYNYKKTIRVFYWTLFILSYKHGINRRL